MKRAWLYLFLLVFCASCNYGKVRSKMDWIDGFIYDTPERALVELASIEPALKSDRLRARHSLMNAIALNRLKSDTTDINLILPAFRYFRKHGPDSCLMKAGYCLGWLYCNRQDLESAYVCFNDAQKLVDETTDPYFKVMLYSALGNICMRTNQTEDWLFYVRQWIPEAEKTNRKDWVVVGSLELSNALSSNGLTAEADSIFKQTVHLVDKTELRSDDIAAIARYAISKRNNDPVLSCKLYERLLATVDTLSDDHLFAYAYALLCCHRDNEAFRILDNRQTNPKYKEVWFWKYKTHRLCGDFLAALEDLENYCTLWGKELTDNLNQSVYKAVADNNEVMAEKNAAMASRLKLIALLISALALAFSGFLSLLLYRRKVRHQNERERLESIAESAQAMSYELQIDRDSIQSRLEATQRDLASLNSNIEHLRTAIFAPFQNEIAELGRLYEVQLQGIQPREWSKDVLKFRSRRMEELLSKIKAGPERQTDIENEINRNLDDAVAKFRSDFPEVKDRDVLFVCYMLLHFDNTTIALLTGLSKDNVRQKRHRIIKMMDERTDSKNSLYRLLI